MHYNYAMAFVRLEIPDDIILALGIPADVPISSHVEAELLKLIALRLYEEMKINIDMASRLCGVSVQEFNDILNEHGVNINYDLEE